MPIKFENVGFVYSPKSPYEYIALKNINLEIKDGSFTFIVGKTGSGKSTLIQQLNGLLVPTSGDIYVGEFVVSSNKKIRTKKLTPLRKKVGIVFQFAENQLFEDTLEKDAAFGPINFGLKKEEAIKVAQQSLLKVGLGEDYFKKSPLELSGGEKRLAAIAGVLAFDPDILVLDEPTAGLDPYGVSKMMSLFKKLNEEGKTIIAVTHDMNLVVQYASDVIVLNDGKVVKHTTPDKIFLEDVEQYSLATPLIGEVISKLNAKGMKLDLKEIRDVSSLADAIKLARTNK